jgi:uncharacterized protein (TIGR00156 family)
MKSTFKAPALAAVLALAMPPLAPAQFTGPGAREPGAKHTVARTVAEVLATGNLLRQTGRETYVFKDATGEIQVEIDREDFPAGKPLDATTQVIIEGEVDARVLRAPEIDVERLRLVPDSKPGA